MVDLLYYWIFSICFINRYIEFIISIVFRWETLDSFMQHDVQELCRVVSVFFLLTYFNSIKVHKLSLAIIFAIFWLPNFFLIGEDTCIIIWLSKLSHYRKNIIVVDHSKGTIILCNDMITAKSLIQVSHFFQFNF